MGYIKNPISKLFKKRKKRIRYKYFKERNGNKKPNNPYYKKRKWRKITIINKVPLGNSQMAPGK